MKMNIIKTTIVTALFIATSFTDVSASGGMVFKAESLTVKKGESTMLNLYRSAYGVCTISGGVYGIGQTINLNNMVYWSGYSGVIQNDTTISMTCLTENGTDSKSIEIKAVESEALLDFSSQHTILNRGESTMLQLHTKNMQTCSISGGIYGNGQTVQSNTKWQGISGALLSDATYTVKCLTLEGNEYNKEITVVVKTNNDNIFIFQGNYNDIGTVNEVAVRLARFDTIVLSHVVAISDENGYFTNPTACLDSGYSGMPRLIKEIRRINPEIKIFGYVSSGADAPKEAKCGNDYKVDWVCPNGKCVNFIRWVNAWKAIETKYGYDSRVDGIFTDLIGKDYITELDRDNMFWYVKQLKYKLATNTPIADYNIQYAGESDYMGEGDMFVVEGWYRGLSLQTFQAAAIPALVKANEFYNSKKITAAFVMSESDTLGPNYSIDCNNNFHARNAHSLVKVFYKPGYLFAHQTADLGLNNKKIPDPCYIQ
jgi:hypothetical protein